MKVRTRPIAYDVTFFALCLFGQAIGKTENEIKVLENSHDQYEKLKNYIKIFREKNLKLSTLDLDKGEQLAKELEKENISFDYAKHHIQKMLEYNLNSIDQENSLSFYDELSKSCSFGLLYHLPKISIYSKAMYQQTIKSRESLSTEKDDKKSQRKDSLGRNSLFENHSKPITPLEKNKLNFLKDLPHIVNEFINGEVNGEEVKQFILMLCEIMDDHIKFKTTMAGTNTEQIDSRIKEIKNLINHMSLIFKARTKNNTFNEHAKICLMAVGEGINENFNHYIHSLTYQELDPKKNNTFQIADLLHYLHPDNIHVHLNFMKNLLEKNNHSLDNESILNYLDNLIIDIQTFIDKEGESNKLSTSTALKGMKSLKMRIEKLRIKIENELIIFHTKGKSHTGSFGFKNLLLNLDDHKIANENIQFSISRAERQLSHAFKFIAKIQNPHLKNKRFTKTVFEFLKNKWTTQEDTSPITSVHTVNNTIQDLILINDNIINSTHHRETIHFAIKYMNKCYKRIAGKNAIDPGFKQRASYFNSALSDYRKILNKYAAASQLLSQKNNSTSTSLVHLYVKSRNVHLKKNYLAKLSNTAMSIKNVLLSKFSSNRDTNNEISKLLTDLEISHSTENYLDILSNLQKVYADIRSLSLGNAHRDFIKNVMIDIIGKQILPKPNINLQFPVKQSDLLVVRALISCLKTEKNSKKIEKIVEAINKNIEEINKNTAKFDNLLLTHHDAQHSKFKELLQSQIDKTNIDHHQNRLQRFGKALAEKLTSASIANYAIASGQILVSTTSTASAANALVSGVNLVVPVAAVAVPSVKNGITIANQLYMENTSTTASGNMGNPVDWMNYVWEELAPALMEIFQDLVVNMEGGEDVERFAEHCQKRIMDKLKDGSHLFPPPEQKQERIVYITTAILMNNITPAIPFLPTYVRMYGDTSNLFLERSFEDIAKNCKITYEKETSALSSTLPKEQLPANKSWAFHKNKQPQTGYGTLYFRQQETAKLVAKACGYKKIEHPPANYRI